MLCQPEKYEIHPICKLFPEMPPDEFEKLKESIKTNGLRLPGLLYEGKVLDGRHRYRACEELGVEMYWGEVELSSEFETFDPVAYVVAHNLHRRHLKPQQLATVAANIREYYDQQAKERKKATLKQNATDGVKVSHRDDSGKSRDKVGEAVGVSGSYVDMATKVKKQGEPELFEAVASNLVPIKDAVKLLESPPEVQRQVASGEIKPKDAIKTEAKPKEKPKKRSSEPSESSGSSSSSRLSQIKKLLDELLPHELKIVREWLEDMK